MCAEIAEETLEEARLETGTGILRVLGSPPRCSGFVNKCVNPAEKLSLRGAEDWEKLGKGEPWEAAFDPTAFPDKAQLRLCPTLGADPAFFWE